MSAKIETKTFNINTMSLDTYKEKESQGQILSTDLNLVGANIDRHTTTIPTYEYLRNMASELSCKDLSAITVGELYQLLSAVSMLFGAKQS